MLKINTNFKKVRIPLVLGVLGLSGIFLFQYLTFIPEYSSAEEISTPIYDGPATSPNTYTLMDITYMQDMTSGICERSVISTKTTGNKYQKQLIDRRDGKKYWVAKLADGNCWMTQDLDLDISDNGLEAKYTDILVDWDSESTYKPVATQTNTTTPDDFRGSHGNDAVASYDPGKKYCEGGKCGPNMILDTSANEGHDAQGNYYTWTAATAGTGGGILNKEAEGSICPKGWRLPFGGSNSSISDSAKSGSFGLMIKKQGITSNAGAEMLNSPLHFLYGGLIMNGALSYGGVTGYYWSSTANDQARAHSLNFANTRVSSATYDARFNGLLVRCVSRNDVPDRPIENNPLIPNPNLSVTVDKILTMKLDSNEVNIEPKNGEIMTGDFSAIVSSNSDYTLSITAAEGASTSLVNQNDNIVIAEIPTITSDTSSLTPNENNWAIRLCNNTNKTNCNNYKPITPYGTTNIFLTNGTPTPSTTSLFEVGIGISPSLPSGTYSTNILITASQK